MYLQDLGRVELSDIPEQVRWRGGAHIRGWTSWHNQGFDYYKLEGKPTEYSMDGKRYRERKLGKAGPWKPRAPVKRPEGMRAALAAQFGVLPGKARPRPKGPQPRPAPKAPPTPGVRPAPSAPGVPVLTLPPRAAPMPGVARSFPLPLVIGGVAVAGLGLWLVLRRKR